MILRLSESQKTWALQNLCELVKIPSVSFEGFDSKHVHESARATAEMFRALGFQNVELMQIDNCFPYVCAEYVTDPKKPTLLLYAHHDVQPEGRRELWKTEPFMPLQKDGRLYGRGTADDKAGIMVHAAAFKLWKDSGAELPVNLKVIIEGEEEVGSDHLFPFLKAHQKRFQCDVIVVTDTANIDSGVPSLTTSLRGLVVVEVEVKSLHAPLHSGLWGGGVVDPVQVLTKMLASLTDERGVIQLKSIGRIPEKDYSAVPVGRKEFAKQAGVIREESVPENPWNLVWNAPSLSVNAIQASSEKLANNIVCDRAFARVGIRVTERERAADVQEDLLQHFRKHSPSTVEVNLKAQEPADAWATNPDSPKNRNAFQAAFGALEKAYGCKAHAIGCGASIPFIKPFEESLNAPVITFGVEDPYTLAHSENESLLLSDFWKTIEAEAEFFRSVSKI